MNSVFLSIVKALPAPTFGLGQVLNILSLSLVYKPQLSIYSESNFRAPY